LVRLSGITEQKGQNITISRQGQAIRRTIPTAVGDSCLGEDTTTAPFAYASRLTETILLGVIAGRFPNQTLHWDNATAQFAEAEANQYLEGAYRKF
jgi:hypothetical protein